MKGGLGAPPSGSFTLANVGGSAVYLAATPYFPSGTPFITVGAVPTLGPGATSPLTLTPNAQAFSLPPGRYIASIDFSNAANLSLVATRQLVLTVVPSVAHDFNGDGFGDILWRNSTTTDVGIWLMDGTQRLSPPANLGATPSAWSIVGTGDFNGDGFSDLLWRNRRTATSEFG